MDESSPLLSVQVDVNSEDIDVDCLSVPSLNKEDRNGECDKTTSYRPLNANQTSFVPRRKPFHYDSFRTPIQNSRDMHTAAKFHRYKYISKLSGHNLIIPHHMLPSHLFLIVPKRSGEKQSSLVTIFSVWNTMMGTSLLSIPWAISQAGFALGMILLIVMAGICLYTCYLILKCAEEQTKSGEILEFSDICKKYLGKPGELLSVVFSLAAILGSAIVYWVLMSNFLYNSGKYIHDSIHHAYSVPANVSVLNSTVSPTQLEVLCPPSHSTTSTGSINNVIKDNTSVFSKIWNCQYSVPFFLIVLLFPLCSVKSPTFFTKFNSLGTLSALYLFVFSITKASIWGIHLDFHDQSAVPEFKEHFPALTGILTLAYFIHNCILSITRNQEHPENNARDLSIAYSLVALSYAIVGLLFYMAFPADKSCIQQVLLDNLPASDVMTFVARLFLLFQLTTVFPLLVYIIRVQCMLYLFDKTYPGFFHVFILNLTLVGTCVLFAVVYPHVGNIIRYVGSLSGLAYNYSLPCIVFMMIQRQSGTLSWSSAILHSSIVLLGVLNFVSQFLI